MVRSRHIQLVFVWAVACLGAPPVAWADGWFHLDPLSLEAEIRLDASRLATDGATESKGVLAEEFLRVRQTGYGWDPAISEFSIELIPVFRQEVRTLFDEKETGRGNDLNYGINLGFLQGAKGPFDVNVSSSRTTNVNDSAFSVRNKTDISAHELLFNWKNAYMPLQFRYSKGSYSQIFDEASGATRAQRDEDRERIAMQGRSSKLFVRLDSEDVTDNARRNDYRIDTALLTHRVEWGRGSALWSQINARERSGYNAFRQFNWSERATIHHTDSLRSSTSYYLNSQESMRTDDNQSSDTLTQEGAFRLDHSLYRNLSSYLRLLGRQRDSDLVDQLETEIGGGADYRKTFFGRLDVSVNVNGSYRVTDRVSEAGIADVVNERQVADYVDLIILGQPLIVPGTVVVTADDGFTYLEGFDYEVLPFGTLFTELRIIPSGRITIGESLLVSYRYDPLPSANFDTFSPGYGFSMRYKWLRVFHSSSRSDNELNEGSILPPDRRQYSTGIEAQFQFSAVRGSLRAEQRYRRIGGFENDSIVLNQVFNISTASANLNLSLTGNQVFSDSTGAIFLDPRLDEELQKNDIKTDYYAFDAILNWLPRSNVRVSPSLGYWRRKEEVSVGTARDSDRRYLAAGLRISWFVRQLMMELYYRHNDVDTSFVDTADTTKRVDDRLMFTVRRQFR